ncbi:precorrin-6y C5,15-methyltransferase (decarboxylating) subunit CbiE [Oxynema sp. CENA135]|uniref:precorrin-6y C5,15-methyltransferase (decarboxylating) subunit CbiE n=1 Tax=Oxynema sp. CENA135 TaxID=984206 RepID=UPI001909C023|nr:precorrin-6y C5,15-methyltransferase (decarboxylating) subunit CbiE [Oxynema sp. CENA135]MBK4728911.1 precorrin-6y C5,15-methyltransferase (decarboxylating) subunit CbiE [Oxynema sp. CENA135]
MIHVVGIGLDGAEGLSAPVREIVDAATLLVGSDRHLGYFPEHPARRLVLGDLRLTLKSLRRKLDRAASARENPAIAAGESETASPAIDPERVAILVSGDPLFFGLGRLLLTEFPPESLHFYPHLSCVQLAFNRVKVPWQDACIVSAHGRSLDECLEALQRGEQKIAVLTDRENSPSAIARVLLGLDLPSQYEFWVCENLGGSDERVRSFAVNGEEAIAALDAESFASLNVVVLVRRRGEVGDELEIDDLPRLGLSDRTFLTFRDRPGLMTKREIRLIVLGELGLKPDQTVWDVGAGTGTVAIEVARLFPSSQVYAIEKTAAGINLIEQNCQRLQVRNVISIHGNAPDILDRLPVPDRIFIGGTGGRLRQILGVCAGQLAKGGNIVLAIATVEHLTTAFNWIRDWNWPHRALQVQVSRSVPVAHLTRFAPLNPVTILTITKPK